MTAEIRLSRGVPIRVNDAGETIVMNVEDQTFVEKFYGLIDRLEAVSGEMQSEAVKNMGDHDQLLLMIERTKPIMAEIDAIFGPESCRKVFGDIVPNPYLMADFFDQLKPIAEQYVSKRQEEIKKKYNNHRKGSAAGKTKR